MLLECEEADALAEAEEAQRTSGVKLVSYDDDEAEEDEGAKEAAKVGKGKEGDEGLSPGGRLLQRTQAAMRSAMD